jgi:hypothetical protein
MNSTTDGGLGFSFDLSNYKSKLLSSQDVHPITNRHVTCQLSLEPSQQQDMAIL